MWSHTYRVSGVGCGTVAMAGPSSAFGTVNHLKRHSAGSSARLVHFQ